MCACVCVSLFHLRYVAWKPVVVVVLGVVVSKRPVNRRHTHQEKVENNNCGAVRELLYIFEKDHRRQHTPVFQIGRVDIGKAKKKGGGTTSEAFLVHPDCAPTTLVQRVLYM